MMDIYLLLKYIRAVEVIEPIVVTSSTKIGEKEQD